MMAAADPLATFASVWLVDFEFYQPDGERPAPLCMVAREWRSGRTIRLWGDELQAHDRAPFSVGPDALFVAYYASAELSCHLALDWPLPVRVLDLFAEFRCLTSGLAVPSGNGLLGALVYYGLPAIDAAEKAGMRDLAMRGGPYTDAERAALLAYCESDVVALAQLLPAMLPSIDLPRALLRGRYMAAAARMEAVGVPIGQKSFHAIRDGWGRIKGQLIRAVDAEYGVFVPAGWKPINGETPLGAAIVAMAAERDLDPHALADAVDYVWSEDRAAVAEVEPAKAAARRATGLTPRRMAEWERRGRDSATWPGLDVQARALAGEYPELGIGRGYVGGDGYDDTDYAARLWDALRAGPRRPNQKHDADILRRAADMLAEGAARFDPVDLAHDTVVDDRPLTFSARRFAEYLARANIPWPRLASGALDLSDDTFRGMARTYPSIAPLRELRDSLSQLRLSSLTVGADGRNRCMLSAFRSTTGRNQPSNAKFIFGPSVWLRGLIRPAAGWAVAYIDWAQQEFGIAAALSGDAAMRDAYASGDPYLMFAKQAGAVPANATKATHKAEREQFKVCALAVQYGMGQRSLAESLGQPEAQARELLRLHRSTYPRFWVWSQGAVDHAMLRGWLQTVFGWRVHVGPEANPRSLANFPMQANGAEMLRLACCLATERGIRVCAPVHDALLIEAPTEEIETVVGLTQAAMAEASRIVLDGFELGTDAKIVRYPDRYTDPRGKRMWGEVWRLLGDAEAAEPVPAWDTPPVPQTGIYLSHDGTPAPSYFL